MTQDDIVSEIIALLRDHKEGFRGSMHQEPYTHDFFRVFAIAYNARFMSDRGPGNLRADALNDLIVAREPDLVDGEPWNTLRTFWSDWTYAWDQSALRH
jgi:hypothetical protein